MRFAVPVFIVVSVSLYTGDIENAWAAEQDTPLEPIIISSSRIPTTLEHSITSIEVIDREIIESSGASSVTELLRFQAGLHVQQNGSRGAIGSIFLRNNDPNYIAVIIDGVKVNDPTNSRGGSFDFSSIDINSIERIEIVKGAMSSMYGSDALAGVIYITTRRIREDATTQLNLTSGTNRYNEVSALAQHQLADTDITLGVAYLDEGEQTEFSRFINRSVNLNTESFIDDGKKLSFHGRYNKSDANNLPDSSGGEEFAVIREVDVREVREASLGLGYDQDVTPAWSYHIELSKFNHDEDVISPGVEMAPGIMIIPPNTSDSEYQREHLLWNNNIEINSKLQLGLGFDKQWENGSSFGTQSSMFGPPSGSYNLKRHNQGIFFESLYGSADDVTFKLGLRHDNPEDASNQTTGNIGLRYARGEFVYTASAGTGYKLPSFFALGNFLVGNPDLVAEESEYWEVGVKRVTQNQRLEWHASIFAYNFENLVDYDAATFSMVNRDEVTSEGAEASIKLFLNRQDTILLDFTYTETEIVNSDNKLSNRPRWRATGQWQHEYTNSITSMASLLYVDEVYEYSEPTGGVTLDDYYRIDFSVNWKYSRQWFFRGTVENITDAEYQETIGTDSPGATVRVSIVAKL